MKRTVSKKKTVTLSKKKKESSGYAKCKNCGGDGVVRVRKRK